MRRSRVLVVDDERFFREAIQDVLSGAGHDCVLAEDGQEALERAGDAGVGVVVLDLQLPDLHGLEVFRRLRERRPDLRVVILSASTDQENVLEALRLGACDYLAKPLHEEELALAVGRALDTHALAAGLSGLREGVRRLDGALARLRERARAGEDAEALREAAAEAAARLLGASKTSLLELDEEAGVLRPVAAHGRKVPARAMDAVAPGEGPAGQAFARGEAIVVEDVAADGRFAGRAPAERYDGSSFAVAPGAVAGRAALVLCATDRVGGAPFGEEDGALLRILAGETAALLAAATASAPAAEPGEDPAPADAGAAPEPTGELARAVCEAITVEVEPARVLEAALRAAGQALGAAPVSLYVVDPASGALRREAEWDGGRRSDRPELPARQGLTGTVLETGALVATGAPAEDPRFEPTVDTPADGRPAPLVCGALRFRGKVLGVFRAFPEAPEQAAAPPGEVLCAALSAALRNVLLYRSLVQSIEEVAQARREAGRRGPGA